MAYSDEALYNMSDEDLHKAFMEAKADGESPALDIEEDEIDLEQPDGDSDYETSSDDEVEVEVDEGIEVDEEGDPDEEPDSDTEEPADAANETDDDEQPVQKRKYKANGKEYEFTEKEIFDQFGRVFGQAMDYTKKAQQLKPWRKTIDAIEEAKLSHDEVALAIDVLRGDKSAIAEVLKRTGIDALEIDTDNVNYAPKDYGRNDTELAIKEIVDEIGQDQEYAITYNVLEKQWDENSRTEFFKNPALIRDLHIDVKSGMFDTITPIANKLKVYDGGRNSDLEYYKLASQQYFADLNRAGARAEAQVAKSRVAEVKSAQEQRAVTKTASVKRKAAAPTAKASGVKQSVDYLETSDEKFEDWYKQLQESM